MSKRPRESNKTPPEPTTYHSLASAGLELETSGRFAVDATIVGRDPAPYPAQPAGSPWASDPVPPEEPTGESIEAMIPVGEVFEIEASQQERVARERRDER